MHRFRVLFALALAALLLTGCSGSSEDVSDSTAGAADARQPDAASAQQDGGAALSAPQPAGIAVGRATPGGWLIRTGELEVIVDDVRKAADEAARLIGGAGGNVEAEERSSAGRAGTALLRLRVPPAAFDATLGQLASLGDERTRRLGSENVSEQVVDLDSRLSTQRASVERVRALLGEAANLGEVVQIEAELTKRTADLESLQARLAALTAQVDLATITLRLTAADAPVAAGSGPLGFSDGLREGWQALTAFGRAVGLTAGALLPFSPVLAGGAYLLWRGRSRRTA